MIAGTVKSFGLPIDYVLYDMSYSNLVMYGAVLPSYSTSTGKDKDESINADDPRDREQYMRIILED
ncbi:MAG: hypothetical protein J6B62_05975 [Bacteroidales bacterium]|nr:hypothetical protein [Bacteroidales bacterium]